MFCYRCGQKVEEDYIYCPNCGAALCQDTDKGCFSASGSLKANDPKDKVAEGLMVIDSEALSVRFNTERTKVVETVNEFVRLRRIQGVNYYIVDLYDHLKRDDRSEIQKVLETISRKVSVTERNTADVYYLFLVGGYDIIPTLSYAMRAPGCQGETVKLDSDLLYHYAEYVKPDDYNSLGSLLGAPIKFYVGRLPLACDTSMADFIRMLNNILEVGYNGLPHPNIHAQSDPNWKKISANVAMALPSGRAPVRNSPYFYGDIMLSPEFTATTQLFRNNFPYDGRSVYYFNLHGSNSIGVYHFLGNSEDGRLRDAIALTPADMSRIEKLNIVVTEACFGAWFKTSERDRTPRRKADSILLSAMHAKSVTFVGSSHVAYGLTNEAERMGTGADLLAFYFLSEITRGSSSGSAMFDAKRRILSEPDSSGYLALYTALEFNLFGEPSLKLFPKGSENYGTGDYRRSLYNPDLKTYREPKVKWQKKSASGLLGLVRSMVDSNINSINDTLRKHLNEVYGLVNPELVSVITHFNPDGREMELFFYSNNGQEWLVEIDSSSNAIKNCLTSK